MDRRERILASLPKGLGLEIGASHNPLAAGDPAFDVRTLDYLDQAGLIEKFTRAEVDVSRIQPVDYVWSGQRYLDLVGDTRFDWVLASHVIEHVPDLVAFINECGEILKPGGMLSLMAPDRRWEFDYYRPAAGLGSVLDAHLQKRRLSSPGQAAEFVLYAAGLQGLDAWSPEHEGVPDLRDDVAGATKIIERASTGGYVDIHAWVFTAHSFRLLIEDLHALGYLKLREASFEQTGTFEFYIKLSADGAGPGLSRLELCNLALDEAGRPRPAPQPEPKSQPAPQPDPAVAELARVQAENARLRDELAAHQASTSWKVTAPLRALRRLAG